MTSEGDRQLHPDSIENIIVYNEWRAIHQLVLKINENEEGKEATRRPKPRISGPQLRCLLRHSWTDDRTTDVPTLWWAPVEKLSSFRIQSHHKNLGRSRTTFSRPCVRT